MGSRTLTLAFTTAFECAALATPAPGSFTLPMLVVVAHVLFYAALTTPRRCHARPVAFTRLSRVPDHLRRSWYRAARRPLGWGAYDRLEHPHCPRRPQHRPLVLIIILQGTKVQLPSIHGDSNNAPPTQCCTITGLVHSPSLGFDHSSARF